MKVQVTVANSSKANAIGTKTIETTVSPADTVLAVQELIASMTNTFSFPDQKLLFKGNELAADKRLSDCGIQEGDALDFVFQGSEESLAKQLSGLLGQKSMSVEELGLLYSYRFAVSVDDCLKAMGLTAQLRGFLDNQKCFNVNNGFVKTVVADKPAAQTGPIDVHIAVEICIDGQSAKPLYSDEEEDDNVMRLDSSSSVSRAKTSIATSQQVPFTARELLHGSTVLADELSLAEAGVKNGATLVMKVQASEAALASQLEELLMKRQALSPSELGLHYCQRFGTPINQALRILGLHSNVRRFLEGQPRFILNGGCVTLAAAPKLTTPISQQEVMDALLDFIAGSSFLNVEDAERDEVSASVFVNGLPPAASLAGLTKAVASSIVAMESERFSIRSADAVKGTIRVQIEGFEPLSVQLRAAKTVKFQ